MQPKSFLERKIVISADTKNVQKLELDHKVVDVVNRANRKARVILLWYNVDQPESLIAQFQSLPRKNEDEKFQRNLYMNSKNEDFIYLLAVMDSVYDKIIAKELICKVL